MNVEAKTFLGHMYIGIVGAIPTGRPFFVAICIVIAMKHTNQTDAKGGRMQCAPTLFSVVSSVIMSRPYHTLTHRFGNNAGEAKYKSQVVLSV